MKKLFAFLLALVMVLSLAACGGDDDKTPSGSEDKKPSSQQQQQNTPDPGTSGQSEKATVEDYAASVVDYVKSRHNEATFIYYSYTTSGLVTVYACDQAPGNSDNCIVTSYWGYNGRQSAYERDKEAELIGDNVERASVEVTWNDELLCYSYENPTNPNSWTAVESHAADYTVAQERGESAAQPQGGDTPDTSGQEETPGTDTPTPSDDVETVAGFLAVFGLTEDDIMPAHFISFDDPEMEGRGDLGELDSGGFITINVDKDATTQEDINAWFETIYAKMPELSSDGKLYANFQGTEEATPLADLMANPLWAVMPGGSCAYPYDLPIGTAMLNVATSYDTNTGIYHMSIGIMSLVE